MEYYMDDVTVDGPQPAHPKSLPPAQAINMLREIQVWLWCDSLAGLPFWNRDTAVDDDTLGLILRTMGPLEPPDSDDVTSFPHASEKTWYERWQNMPPDPPDHLREDFLKQFVAAAQSYRDCTASVAWDLLKGGVLLLDLEEGRTLKSISEFLGANIVAELLTGERGGQYLRTFIDGPLNTDSYGEHVPPTALGAFASYSPREPRSPYYAEPVDRLVSRLEDVFLEHKETLKYDVRSRQPNPDLVTGVVNCICGFWNARGGTLLVGVQDRTRRVMGLDRDLRLFKDIDEMITHLNTTLRRSIPNVAPHVEIKVESVDSHSVLRIDVPRGDQAAWCQEQFWLRSANSTCELKGPALFDYLLSRIRWRAA